MRIGVCHYPEALPREEWSDDARSMKALGLDLVRIGEFAWSTMEPARDVFEFGWLDEAIEVFSAAGLGVILGTPTAAPPLWLSLERPSILLTHQDGRRAQHGSRRHVCMTSEAYRWEAARVVGALLDRYANHPAVVAWQVDNEPGNHDSARCWCDECQAAFSVWLEQRFGTIEALNQAWGTAFWSQTYPVFESVALPVPTLAPHHPSLLMAHRKFASDQSVDFIAAQTRLIKERVGAEVEITTNLYAEDLAVDARAVAALDGLASMDSYPHGTGSPMTTAFHLDLTASAAGPATRAWVMEQQAGPVNWTEINPQVPDGQVRVWTWQAALHGFDALLYFRWKPARHGQELYHSGLHRHDGSPTAAFHEIAATIEELRQIGPLSAPRPRVALLHSYKDAWAIDINPHRKGMSHRSIQLEAYRAARRLGLEVAVVDSTTDLSRYELVLAPGLQVTTPERVRAITGALEAGTRVVLGARSLVVDRENAWSDQTLPAGLHQRLGARVVDHLSQTDPVMIEPYGVPAGVWTDVLEVGEAAVLATYSGGTFLDGRPAVVDNNGLFYAGFASEEAWTALLADLTGATAGPPDTEVFERDDRRFVIDHRRLTVTW
jgi:beta-galactosidase